MNELQLYNDVIIFAFHKLNDLMTDKRTQNIKQFLSELSGKALAYLFPGVDKTTIDEQFHAHLTEADVAYSKIESPFPMCPQPKVPAEESIDFAQWQVYSDAIDLPEIECGSLRPSVEERENPRTKPDSTRKAANPKRGRKKRNINFILSELSGKALAYLFPGVDKTTIDEQFHAHLTEADVAYSKIESPFPMCPQPKVPAEESIDFAQWQVYSDAIDLPEIECGSLRPSVEERENPRTKPDSTRKAANPKRGRKKRNINFIREKRYERVNDDLYDEDLRRYSQIEESAVQDLEPDEQAKAILAEIERLLADGVKVLRPKSLVRSIAARLRLAAGQYE